MPLALWNELVHLALTEGFSENEVRLVAVCRDDLPGMQWEPASPVARRTALVVAHLEVPLPSQPPVPDNLSSGYRKLLPQPRTLRDTEDAPAEPTAPAEPDAPLP